MDEHEHVHEWELIFNANGVSRVVCREKGCHERLSNPQIEHRLNATERLSAENARWIAEDYILAYPEHLGYARSKQTDALKSYADTLYGK